MTVDPRVETRCTPGGVLAESLYFKSSENLLFGWLHRPTGQDSANVGLVICNPFGYEAICCHRSVRVFAEAAAALGVPALRFDYSGTGDSAVIRSEADQLDIWSGDVAAAVAELRQRTGIERVCVLGIRLGALLAVMAAGRSDAVNSMILIAPVINGRRYWRELHVTRLAASLSNDDPRPTSGTAEDGRSPHHKALEVSGFTMSASTVTRLGDVDLGSLRSPPAPEILVIDGTGHPSSLAWVAHLRSGGSQTSHLALRGVVEMTMTAPQISTVPWEIVSAVGDWLRGLAVSPTVELRLARHRTAGPLPPPPTTAMPLRDDAPTQRIFGTERPVLMKSGGAELFGILTEPPSREPQPHGVILLNTGADHHIGANGMYVSLARRWVRRGYVVLRMDLAGVGDSSTRPGSPDDDVFPPAALDDIRVAIEFLQSRCSVHDIALAGVCSGAYHALRAAAANAPVERILMVNPRNYFWKAGMTLDELQLAEVVRNPRVYRERMFNYQTWKKLFTGNINIWRTVQVYVHRSLLALESTFRDVSRRLNIRLPRDLGCELEEIAARGVRMAFIFSRDEPGIGLLKLQGGSSVKRLGDRCRVHIIYGADHMFSQSGPRGQLEEILTDELLYTDRKNGPPFHGVLAAMDG